MTGRIQILTTPRRCSLTPARKSSVAGGLRAACALLIASLVAGVAGCGGDDDAASGTAGGAANTGSSPSAGTAPSMSGAAGMAPMDGGMDPAAAAGPAGGYGGDPMADAGDPMAAGYPMGPGGPLGEGYPMGPMGPMGAGDPMGPMDVAGYDPANPAGYGQPGANQPAQPKRPDDVSKWSEQDYLSAVRDGDPQLPKAIELLTTRNRNSPQAAAMLESLLVEMGKARQNQGVDGSGYGGPMGDDAGVPQYDSADPAAMPPAGLDCAPSGHDAAPPGEAGAAIFRPVTSPWAALATAVVSFQNPAAFPVRNTAENVAESAQAGHAAEGAPTAQPMPTPGPQGGHGAQAPPDPANPEAPGPMGYAPGPMGYGPGPMGYGPGDYGQPGGGQSGPRALSREAVFRTLLEGLIVNGTPQAWNTIQKLLAGQITTGVRPETVFDLVLMELIENYGGENHPTGQALAKVRATPTHAEKLSQLTAEYALSAMDAAFGVPTGGAQPSRSNQQDANIPNYGTPNYGAPFDDGAGPMPNYGPMGDDAGFETSAATIDPAASPDGQAGQPQAASTKVSFKPRAIEEGELRNVLAYVARPEVIQAAEARMRAVQQLSGAGQALALAGSLPVTSLRLTVYEILDRRWTDGGQGLMSSGALDAARDPALLLALKNLPQLKLDGEARNRRASTTKAEEERKAKLSWADATRQLVRALNRRFRSAAAKKGAASGVEPPLRLHEGARVAADYTLSWPAEGTSGALDGPVKVQYLRIDAGQADAAQILNWYSRQIKNAKPSGANNNFEVWIESFGGTEELGVKRSIDVMLTISQGNGGGGPGGPMGPQSAAAGSLTADTVGGYPAGGGGGQGPQNVTVEILSVEAPDPRLALKEKEKLTAGR
ncbi:MAG: hypothetical protein KY476_16495 [Planctomycetes bacterium]|nr:hypothetical protein [Planctomycetota bacterium]